jgi:hypothetical protein
MSFIKTVNQKYKIKALNRILAGDIVENDQLQITAANVLYHGSPVKFSKLKIGKGGKNYGEGIYLTEKKQEAFQYAMQEDEDSTGSGYIYTVNAQVSKPFDVRNQTQAKQIAEKLDLDWEQVLKNEDWKDPYSGYDESDKDNLYIKIANTLANMLKGSRCDFLIHQAMKKLGFDSIHDTKEQWFVLQDPNKVKIVKTEFLKGIYHGRSESGDCQWHPTGKKK